MKNAFRIQVTKEIIRLGFEPPTQLLSLKSQPFRLTIHNWNWHLLINFKIYQHKL